MQRAKDKAPSDLSVLVLSLSTIIKMMIAMFSGVMEQNNKQTATISDMEQTISGLKQTISDLQENIKDLQRQLNMDSHNS